MENEKLFELMSKMYTEFSQKFDNLESKVDKNSLLLEKIQTDVKTIAEVQTSFTEQLDRTKDKDGKSLGERLELIELAVMNTSKSVAELVDTIDVIKDTTGSHEMDIKILKKIQNSSSRH